MNGGEAHTPADVSRDAADPPLDCGKIPVQGWEVASPYEFRDKPTKGPQAAPIVFSVASRGAAVRANCHLG